LYRIEQPSAREFPLALDGRSGELHHLSDLLDRETAKVLELDDAALARIDRLEPFQCLVEGDHVHRRRLGGPFEQAERNAFRLSAPLRGGAVAGIVEQNAP